MTLTEQEKAVLWDTLNLRIKELSGHQNFWTGKTPRAVIDKALQSLNDNKALRAKIFPEMVE